MIINEPEAFYTGGGIWLSAMYVNDHLYAVVSSEDDDCLSLYSHNWEDKDIDFPCQNMLWSAEFSKLENEAKLVYGHLYAKLKEEMDK